MTLRPSPPACLHAALFLAACVRHPRQRRAAAGRRGAQRGAAAGAAGLAHGGRGARQWPTMSCFRYTRTVVVARVLRAAVCDNNNITPELYGNHGGFCHARHGGRDVATTHSAVRDTLGWRTGQTHDK